MTVSFDTPAFHEQAVRTPSHESVEEMRALLVETLRTHDVHPTIDDAGNTLATKAGTDEDAGPHVVLNTHIDTVPPHIPFRREGDTVYGRGACDAKGPLAALLEAFLASEPSRGRLTLAITPDEETRSTGAAALDVDGDLYIVGEPTGLDICSAAKGRFEGTITIDGANAHAAEPDAGVNAVAATESVFAALRNFDTERGSDEHPHLGAPTLTPTVIRGGDAVNQIPDACTIVVDRRSVPPETADGFERALNEQLGEYADVSCEFALTDRQTPFLEAFATDVDSELVRTVRAAGGGDVRPFTAATEASYFSPAPTIVFGPGTLADEKGAVAHADREYVSLSEIQQAGEIIRETIGSLLC